MRGAAPPVRPSALPGASRQTWLLLPPIGAPPHAPGDFLPDEKVTKESPRGGTPPLGTPLGGPSEKCFTFRSRSPCGKPHPLDRAFSHNKRPICHFEMSGQIGLFFSPRFTGVTLSAVNPWRGGFAPRMPRAFLPTTNTARAQGRGIKGGYAPFAGGPGTRRSLVSLW